MMTRMAMPCIDDPPTAAPHHGTIGEVVVHRAEVSDRAPHDRATTHEIARRLAAIKGYRFAGEYEAGCRYGTALYFVPGDTMIGVEHAHALGITTEHDLFGGVVPHPFVATKCISHRLVDADALAPQGWSEAFARRVQPAVLRGFAAFRAEDALRAGLLLLARGPVRIKRALGIGGFGQTVATNRAALEQALADTDADEVARYGVSLEEDLADVITRSVGQVRVGDLVASYCGTQRLTRNNAGDSVYGGSDLLVARGGFDVLLALQPGAAACRAVEQARLFDDAAFECFPGLLASRRNYDVAQGIDVAGEARSGVLEQSWRIGGASGAEVAALAAFRSDPALQAVRASSIERYGADASPPAHASVYFRGDDPRVGPLMKYATVERHGDA